jgi:hypothetical protein
MGAENLAPSPYKYEKGPSWKRMEMWVFATCCCNILNKTYVIAYRNGAVIIFIPVTTLVFYGAVYNVLSVTQHIRLYSDKSGYGLVTEMLLTLIRAQEGIT